MDRYLRVNYEKPGVKLLDGLVPYMHYVGVPHSVIDGFAATAPAEARRDVYFITPPDVTKPDVDAWIQSARTRGHAGCLPPYGVISLTQTDYELDDEEKQDGYEYLLCWYDRRWTKSSLGRFRTHDSWEEIRGQLIVWARKAAKEVGGKAFRVPGWTLRPPAWYPPY